MTSKILPTTPTQLDTLDEILVKYARYVLSVHAIGNQNVPESLLRLTPAQAIKALQAHFLEIIEGSKPKKKIMKNEVIPRKKSVNYKMRFCFDWGVSNYYEALINNITKGGAK